MTTIRPSTRSSSPVSANRSPGASPLALAGLADPEDVTESVAGMPATLAFSALHPEVLGRGVAGIVDAWLAGGDDPPLAVVVGASVDGVVELDLDRDGPHALIAGTTGSGKSELLRTIVVGLAAAVSPAHLQFVLVDYKGGATFDGCRTLPHTVGLVTDLEGGLAERALVSLEAELTRRERLFRDAGAADLREYRTRGRPPLSRLVVMIDEFATMAQDVPGFLPALVGIAQRGRSLGVHLVLATQRPAGVVNDDIRANTNLRLALRVNDRADGIDVVGDDLPATFPRQRPGRCAVRLGHDELVVFQAASTAGPPPTGRRILSVRRWPPTQFGPPAPPANDRAAHGLRRAVSHRRLDPPCRRADRIGGGQSCLARTTSGVAANRAWCRSVSPAAARARPIRGWMARPTTPSALSTTPHTRRAGRCGGTSRPATCCSSARSGRA